MYDAIAAHVASSTGRPFKVRRHADVGGGCINRAVLLEGTGGRFFVKLNRSALRSMFEGEYHGLEAIRATSTLRAPRPVCCGVADGHAYLVLEFMDMAPAPPSVMTALGWGLAALHRATWTRFGWHRDNTIGSTPQINTPRSRWPDFLRDQRLGYQLRLAAGNGLPASTAALGERLLDRLDAFFAGYAPAPSLLHGDLWGGNVAADASGMPVVFDPAAYFGDREADLAMTELFGGFGRAFYDAYDAAWPLDAGYGLRRDLYNLYHVLNHFNLFGGGYAAQVRAMIERLLAVSG